MNDALIPLLKDQIEADRRLLVDSRRLHALLNDLAPELRSARHLAVQAVEAGVVAALNQRDIPIDALTINRLIALMIEDFSVTEQAARWAVGVWCQVLGKQPATSLPAPEPAIESAADSPELQSQIATHHRLIFALAWHPSGAKLASGGADSSVRLWSPADHGGFELAHTLISPTAWVTALGWTAKGADLVAAGEDQVLWWSVRGRLRRTLSQPFGMARWSPDGAVVALARNQTLRLWHILQDRELRRLAVSSQVIDALAWSADGAMLASAGSAGVVDVWRVADGQRVGQFQHPASGILTLAWHPRLACVAWAGPKGGLALGDLATQSVQVLASELATIRCLAWHPDGKLLAAGDGAGRLELWRIAEARRELIWEAHERTIYGLAWHPRGDLLASGGGDGLIKLWEVGR